MLRQRKKDPENSCRTPEEHVKNSETKNGKILSGEVKENEQCYREWKKEAEKEREERAVRERAYFQKQLNGEKITLFDKHWRSWDLAGEELDSKTIIRKQQAWLKS